MANRRSFVLGMLIGVAGAAVLGAVLGAGRGSASDDWFVTSDDHGRTAYLWQRQGDRIVFVNFGQVLQEDLTAIVNKGIKEYEEKQRAGGGK